MSFPDSPALRDPSRGAAVGPDLVACHSTAAALWGFDVLGAETLHFLGPAELVNRAAPGIQVHPSSLGCDDAVRVEGVWCTPPARTACDVVRLTPPDRRPGDPGRRSPVGDVHRGANWPRPPRRRPACARWFGCGAGALRRPRAESPMESRMRWRFIDGGLPAPDLQVALPATAE